MHFLHMADVHFGCERGKDCSQADIAARNNYMEKLTDTICDINKNKKLDFILFTGDIAWSASSDEYSNAAKWLKDLLARCGLTSKNLFMCPGNHDIDRNEAEDIQYPIDQKMADRFLQVEKLKKLQRRFSQYMDFCDKMGLEKYIIGNEKSYLTGCRDMGDYRIVCLNTAWYAKNDEVKDKMWIGAGFSEILKEELKNNCKPTITIMHHPSTFWHEQERSDYIDTMNVYTEVCMFSDIVLTGHCHEIYTSPEFKGKALIAGTGALFERKNYVNCFYAYDIDFTKEGNQNRIQYFWNANHWCNYEESFKLQSTYCRDLKIKTGHEKPVPVAMASQSNLYHIAGQIVKYIPIVGSWKKGEDEYYYGDFKVQTCNEMYQLPREILDCFHNQSLAQEEIASIKDNLYEEKVRFDEFKVQINGGDHPHIFTLRFSRATYRDFLIVKSVIDQALPSGETVRAKYLSEKNTLISHKLPNVCGVGIFIITSDKKLLISKSSPYVLVNPEQYIYSASGSMNWKGISTNPFHDIIRECEEEIGYTPDIDNLILYSVGMDYTTGYYQFSFYEYSIKTAAEIMEAARMARDFHIEIEQIIPVDFNCDEVMNILLKGNIWDETAKANLFTLAAKNFGVEIVKKYLTPCIRKKDYRRGVAQMWDMRADRRGRLPVLSSRYPAQGLEKNSDAYVKAVLNFIDEDLSNKTILELGGGIGLFTKYFAERAKEVTCVDVCDKMIQKSKQYLGLLSHRVDYINCFFQDYETSKHFDILVCSLVLIHNAPELDEITRNMKRLADVIYLFEHTDQETQVGMYTDLKTVDEYIAMFPEYAVIKQSSHMLCQDKISFIKFQKNS